MVMEKHQEFERRFAEQWAIIYADGTTFSGSEVFASLQAIEELATQIGVNSRERARILALMCELQRRRGEWEDAVTFGEQSLAIQSVSGDLDTSPLFHLHYAVAVAAEEIELFDKAVAHYRMAVQLMAMMPELSEGQRLGIRETLGRALHEAGAYEEAKATNLATLGDAERQFGAHDPRLRSLLNNLAQNEYSLGNIPGAESYLNRRLQLARDAKQLDIELDTLFQLGVLAFESGRIEEAKRLMSERVSIARSRGDSFDVKAAERDLAELDRLITAAAGGKER
jgi:tetratricopeptide (TPR) repeat protein